MQVLHLATADLEGGAGRAALRLNAGFKHTEVESKMLVRAKSSAAETVLCDTSLLTKLSPSLNRFYIKCRGYKPNNKFSPQWFPDTLASKIKRLNPDIVHLHWICNGFVKIETLRNLRQPIVWTLHDMWPFTGGCHYSEGCKRYEKSCGKCLQLNSNKQSDLSNQVLARKINAWEHLNLTIITPSRWLAECARASSLFKHHRIEVIPNGIDTRLFSPIDKGLARKILDLPLDSKIILFAAGNPTGDPRKGFSHLVSALQKLKRSSSASYELAILGTEEPKEPINLGFKAHYLGKLTDETSLALVYSAANLFVAPSREDNLPNTVVESMACGLPCVAFNIGGMPDMITHLDNGYLATPYDDDDLAAGIEWVFKDQARYSLMCAQARGRAKQKFSIQHQVSAIHQLYRDILP